MKLNIMNIVSTNVTSIISPNVTSTMLTNSDNNSDDNDVKWIVTFSTQFY